MACARTIWRSQRLGISEIVVYVLKNEDWLARGVKNVNGLPRPVPYEVDLQTQPWPIDMAATLGTDIAELSSIIVKLCYAGLFIIVLAVLFWLFEIALRSPWGRMMRAIRDNEVAANAMGKDVKAKHLQVFVLGSAVIGVAGAMLTTLDGGYPILPAASLYVLDLDHGYCGWLRE